MLVRLAEWCYAHRRRVVILWLVALAGVVVLSTQYKGEYTADYSAPGSESKRAFDLLSSRFPARAGDTVDVVWRSNAGATSPAVKAHIQSVLDEAGRAPHVIGVTSPFDPAGGRLVSADGTIAKAELQLDSQASAVERADAQVLLHLVEAANRPDIQVEAVGELIANAQSVEVGSERLGAIAAAIILVITLGSLVAAGLPLLVTLFGLGVASMLISLMLHVVDVPDWAPTVAAMIGIGVGVDYALFIITRYRTGLDDGMTPHRATIVAMATAGRAVLFAGCTVLISLLGMLAMRQSYTPGIAFSASLTVAVIVLAALTLLPALLGFAGRSINRLHIPFLARRAPDGRSGMWFTWSRTVQRRPWPAALAGLAVLLLLSAPLLTIRFGFPDASNSPIRLTTRRGSDLLTQGFGPGYQGPLLLASVLPVAGELSGVEAMVERVRAIPGVAAVSPAQPNPAGDTAIVSVIPEWRPQDVRTERLVDRLREQVLPGMERQYGLDIHMGGVTALSIDSSRDTITRLPYFIGAVVLMSFLLLLVVFRSILVAVKAAIMNLLSIGAAYGVMALGVRGGWFGGLLGIEEPTPIPSFIPMMMFAILFGLSMDYEVFLLSRVREEYDKTKDNALAVADGLAATARVITAAAAIMVVVFLAFVLNPEPLFKMIGLGLATAIFVDATIVRMVLVPATMELLGDANWWLPRWLDRLLPDVHVEGHTEDADAVLDLDDLDEVPEPA